jgi:hypothetical protein
MKPPEAKPPSARPPEAKPPSARPPEAKPPSARPPEARPPEAQPPSATPPGVSPTSYLRHTKITAGNPSTVTERQRIAEDQACREAEVEGTTAYAVTVEFPGVVAKGNDAMMVWNVSYRVRPQ